MNKKWSGGKIAAIICGCMVAGVVLFVTFYISVFQIVRGFLALGEKNNKYDYSNNSSLEYYEFHNEIRDDLSYQVRLENYEEEFGDNGNISVKMSYPVVSGKDDLEAVNKVIQKELDEVRSYTQSVTEWLSVNERFKFEAECYVTYMDEEVLSLAYIEYGYLNDEYYESYVISVNIDMESKMLLTNSQLLDIDDKFSVDFRERCEVQNGRIESLAMYSDQEITKLLTSDSNLIIFYTPLGMEVGFNYYYGWVTVTYQDYQDYQKQI